MIGPGRLCQVHKRESLLSAALDYGLLPFLSACIRQFSAPELVSRGLNLRFLLDWTWKRVAYVKDSIDKLCECPLTESRFFFSRCMLKRCFVFCSVSVGCT